MSTAALVQQLQTCQAAAVALCEQAGADYQRQPHADISPVGWHLGHCIYTESYWLHEMFLQDVSCPEEQHQLYNPLNTGKPDRAAVLPDQQSLCAWARQTQAENLDCLQKVRQHRDPLSLMENNYLLHFLIQHYAQHLETMRMAFAQLARQRTPAMCAGTTLHSNAETGVRCHLPAGEYAVGAGQRHLPYDNEYPAHRVTLADCAIMQRPLSNANYLRFIEDGGYANRQFWSEAGWRWLQESGNHRPAYWHQDTNGQWSSIDHRGQNPLPPDAPVHGLSYHEAQACARWAGGRLPHEHEWEVACKLGLLADHGRVWEWCHNSFYAYDGFSAYPYNGYSLPYFDGSHFTLKGGSILTEAVIRRPEFRNYYQADKNFLYAGVRLVFDR